MGGDTEESFSGPELGSGVWASSLSASEVRPLSMSPDPWEWCRDPWRGGPAWRGIRGKPGVGGAGGVCLAREAACRQLRALTPSQTMGFTPSVLSGCVILGNLTPLCLCLLSQLPHRVVMRVRERIS